MRVWTVISLGIKCGKNLTVLFLWLIQWLISILWCVWCVDCHIDISIVNIRPSWFYLFLEFYVLSVILVLHYLSVLKHSGTDGHVYPIGDPLGPTDVVYHSWTLCVLVMHNHWLSMSKYLNYVGEQSSKVLFKIFWCQLQKMKADSKLTSLSLPHPSSNWMSPPYCGKHPHIYNFESLHLPPLKLRIIKVFHITFVVHKTESNCHHFRVPMLATVGLHRY